VTGLDELNDAYDPRLKHWRLERLKARGGLRFFQTDIRDRAALERLWDEAGPFDAVLNLAARAGVRQSLENPWVYFDTNTTGTLNLLEMCRHRGVNKFVLASTSSLYGSRNPVPYREDADTNHPLSPYAASKKAAEALCHSYHHLYEIDVTVVRYFTVYGPAGRPDMSLFRFAQWVAEERPVIVFGDGMQSRDFTYVDDIARGTIAALRPLGYEVINLGSDRPMILMDALKLIERLIGKQANIEYQPFHKADIHATWADITAAREKLGWEPAVSHEQGIENLVRWYQQNRDWAREVRTE
jgi:nucleoside-diphosphate-sugar epimerase